MNFNSWYRQLSVLVLLLRLGTCGTQEPITSPSLAIQLDSQWSTPSFDLNLLEAIAGHEEDLYIPTLLQLIGIEDEEAEVESSLHRGSSELEKYTAILNSKSLDLSETSKAFINFSFVNKIHYPRVQVHHDYFTNVVEPKLGAKVAKDCLTDSFGNQLKRNHKSSWVLYNDKIYCTVDDLYALQTDSSSDAELTAFDTVIGKNNKAPLLVLYGHIESKDFRDIFANLHESAKTGKIRFVWRYLPNYRSSPSDTLSGYGVDLSLKRGDYVVIDERDIKKSTSSKKSKSSKTFSISKDFWKILESSEIEPIAKEALEDLGSKLSSLVLYNSYKNATNFEILDLILSDFPKFASHIGKASNLRHLDEIKAVVKENEEKGLSKESYGLYINGSPLHKLELDILTLIEKIEDELRIIRDLKVLGFSSDQAKFLIKKFALLSAVKQQQFRSGNTIMGKNENRFRVYENVFTSGAYKRKRGVVFLNDIEKDGTYDQYSSDRDEVYLGAQAHKLKSNQIPPLKENVHDLIFALNFSNKQQLKVLFALAKVILDSGIPQQIGIIAIGDNERDRELAEKFYFITDTSKSQEALAFLYKFLETKDEAEVADLLNSIYIPQEYDFDHGIYEATLEKFSIHSASVVFNGVIYELASSNWQLAMSTQLSQDIALLKHHLRLGTSNGKSLKSLLYDGSKSTRNSRIIPLDPSDVLYKSIDEDFWEHSVAFKRAGEWTSDIKDFSGTFWLVGDFNKQFMVDQLKNLLELMKRSSEELQIRIINTGFPIEEFDRIEKSVSLNSLSTSDIDSIIDTLNLSYHENSESTPNLKLVQLLERKNLPVRHDFLLFNSRYFRLDKILNDQDLDLLVEYEFNQRLSIFNDLVNAYPREFDHRKLLHFNSALNSDNLDWFDLVSTIVTKSFTDGKFYYSDVSRFDFSGVNMEYSLDVTDPAKGKPIGRNKKPNGLETDIEILLIIDPVDEYSQKLVSIVNSVKDLPFVSVKILLQPTPESSDDIHIKRFYRGVYPSSTPEFDENESWKYASKAFFNNLPSSEILTVELDSPSKWITVTKDSPIGVDLDNLRFENLENNQVNGVYELKSLLVEGYARDVGVAKPPTGLAFEIENGGTISDTSVMSTLGYFQLHAKPGVWDFRIKAGKSKESYQLLSAAKNKFLSNYLEVDSVKLSVFDLKGKTLYPRLQKRASSDLEQSKDVSAIGHADINIFSIASGHLYERFLSIMTASVRKHSAKSIKFWIVENFISSHFKKLLPHLAQKYDFQYELITYKWPSFLRTQREKQRTIWGYKILFLDVLFPQDLDKIIFVDADQIVRTDLSELVDLDLQGAPYGFTPMCDSREEMEGFRFWKQGYWSNVLEDDLKYHISALYVVDLNKFRSINAGDKLRSHYQKLSSDPNSLSNLDQDLPNNLQRQIKIHSLPQEWLWCETWCSDETMKSAKTIDLCNNPLTKENKLDRARRLIPEWTDYDTEISQLIEEVNTKTVEIIEDPEEVDDEDDDEEEIFVDEEDSEMFDHDEL